MQRTFIAADTGDLQPLDDAIATVHAGVRGESRNDTSTAIKLHLWRRLAIHDYAVEQTALEGLS